jgi:hypothetical protein
VTYSSSRNQSSASRDAGPRSHFQLSSAKNAWTPKEVRGPSQNSDATPSSNPKRRGASGRCLAAFRRLESGAKFQTETLPNSPLCSVIAPNGGRPGSIGRARSSDFPQRLQADLPGPVSFAKIFHFATTPNHLYKPRHPAPFERGVSRSSRTLGAGCGGREGRD